METLFLNNPKGSLIFLLVTILWVLPWKIYALWTASKKNHKIWFVVFILVNTLGILEIIYIFYIAKKSWSEVKNAFVRFMSSGK